MHVSPRYTTNGGCVECVREAAAKQQGELATAIREGSPKAAKLQLDMDQGKCLAAGGPWSAEEAVAVGLDWYAWPTELPCLHYSVRLDGVTCNTCGTVNVSKLALELLA